MITYILSYQYDNNNTINDTNKPKSSLMMKVMYINKGVEMLNLESMINNRQPLSTLSKIDFFKTNPFDKNDVNVLEHTKYINCIRQIT